MKRRHRNDPEVSSVAGADWAKRKPPQNLLVKATAAEDAVADELEQVWLHPPVQRRSLRPLPMDHR